MRALYRAPFEPEFPCRVMVTRHCPAVYEGPCGDDRPCARFESDDADPWLPELITPALIGLATIWGYQRYREQA